MACSGAYIGSYFFWAALSGAFLGFALSRVTRFATRYGSPERIRSWKWIFFSIYASTSVILALAGAFLSSSLCKSPFRLGVSEEFLDDRIAYMFGASTVLSFFSLRFKRAVGILILFLLFVATIASGLMLYPWEAPMDNSPIAQFRVLSQDDEGMSVEIISSKHDSMFQRISGGGLQIHGLLLSAADYYFFIKKPFLIRLTGFSHMGGKDPNNLPSSPGLGIWERGRSWLQEQMSFVPGWRIRPVVITGEALVPLFRYGIYARDNFGLYIQLEESEAAASSDSGQS